MAVGHVGRLGVWRALAVLAAVVMALGLVGAPTTDASAQDEGEEDKGEPVELEVTKEAYYNNPSARALPDILVEEFPPGVVCIVIPRLCAEDVEEALEPVNENRPKKDEVRGAPVQPVPPNTLPAARNGGELKYASALHFDLPDVPSGQEIDRFTLVMPEISAFSMNSPATRQAVLAALVGIQEEDEEAAREQAEKIVQDPDTYPPVQEGVLQLEACLAVEDFEEGRDQGWSERPERDCVFGANGERVENEDGDGEWHFDLTLMAQSIADGEIENNGVYIGPLIAENFAFGDPETTDNGQVSMGGGESQRPPFALLKTREELGGGEAFGLEDTPPAAGGTDGFAGTGGGQTGTSGSQEVFSSAPDFSSQEQPAGDPAPVAAQEEPGEEVQAQQTGAVTPGTPWWLWLLVPVGLAGIYVMNRSLVAEPVLATERSGAMTRLIEERRRNGNGLDVMTQV